MKIEVNSCEEDPKYTYMEKVSEEKRPAAMAKGSARVK
jgi:rRNA maturation protein Nop10